MIKLFYINVKLIKKTKAIERQWKLVIFEQKLLKSNINIHVNNKIR